MNSKKEKTLFKPVNYTLSKKEYNIMKYRHDKL